MSAAKADSMTSVFTLNPEQATRGLALCWRAEMLAKERQVDLWTPVVLVGATSTAKTATCKSFVKLLNRNGATEDHKLWLEHASYYADSSDIGGVPYPTDGDGKGGRKKLAYLLNENLPFDDQEKGVLVMDEVDRVRDESIQNAFLQVLNGRCIHGHDLSPNVFVVGTMNGTSDSGTLTLSEAFRGRVCTLFISSRSPGMVESYETWAAGKISNVGMTFSRYRRELLRDDPVFEEIAIPVQRTVDMADLVLQASKMVKFQVADIIMPVVAGLIGKKAAVEFMATEKLIAEAPSVREVLADPDTAKIPENASVCYAMAVTLGDHAKSQSGDRAVLSAMAQYLSRMPAEFAAMAFKRMSKDAASVVTTAPFQKWAKDHKALLI